MRKQAAAVLLAAGVLGGTAAPSYGGQAAINDRGDFLTMDADLAPPVAGTRAKPQPATLSLHQMFGNYRDGSQPPRSTTITVRLPRGMATNDDFVARCPLPKSDAEIVATRCPSASRVGTGSALADARGFGLPNPVPATVAVYNGEERNGQATLILQGIARVGSADVVNEFDFIYQRSSGRFGQEIVTFDPYSSPPPDPASPFITLNRLDLRVGKTVTRRVSGRRVRRGFMETPTSCTSRGWAFEEEFAFASGAPLSAGDVMACTR